MKSGMPQTHAAKALNRSSTSVHQRVGILRDRGLISRPLPAPSLVAALQNAQQTLTSASQSPFERFSSVAVPSTQAAVDHLQAGASSAAATAPQPKFQDLEAAKHSKLFLHLPPWPTRELKSFVCMKSASRRRKIGSWLRSERADSRGTESLLASIGRSRAASHATRISEGRPNPQEVSRLSSPLLASLHINSDK